MNSNKTNHYWEQVDSIATEAVRLSDEWLIPHNIDDVDLLHRLGDNKEKVVHSFTLLELAMKHVTNTHGVSESEVTADIWNLMTTEDNHESDSKRSVSRPN